ncbi:P-loop containing nucleoside triphosphate hydrolase protein [Cladochytrium replicatum]|nr:P-loop containing nucleoside triphosphate hydrolase protein [Cladochytrium replicatum]
MQPLLGKSRKTPPKLWKALAIKFWPYYFLGLFLQVIRVAVAILQPLMIPQVLNLLLKSTDQSSVVISNIYVLAAIFFLMNVLSSVCNYSYQSLTQFMSIRLNGILTSSIYEKSFRISPKASQKFPPGHINTLVGPDTSTVIQAPVYLINLIAYASQLIIAIIFIFIYLKFAAFAPIGLFAALIAFEIHIMPMITTGIRAYNKAMDGRSKALREFIYGIKFIKFQAIEEILKLKIDKIRSEQIEADIKINTVFGFFYGSSSTRQYMIPTISILIYVAIQPEISASTVFTALALLDAIAGPSGAMNMTIGQLIKVPVSYERITEFLLAPEVAPDEVPHRVPSKSAHHGGIVMDAASFTWESVKGARPKPPAPPAPPKKWFDFSKKLPQSSASAHPSDPGSSSAPQVFQLNDISLNIPRGSLVAVVGKVGSGKSSLLSAVAGGMRKTGGAATVTGSIAYCPQEPWIMSGSIEDNITFGDETLKKMVSHAVSAACLDHDLDLMPYGLGTRIGEKGVNLSGGQKTRVSLARAVARDADIYILDDPTAALDAHVGKEIVDHTITGLLRAKTVLWATHQLHLLPRTDFVVVMNNGAIAETGTFSELIATADGVLSDMMKDYAYDEEIALTTAKAKNSDDTVIKAVKNFEIQQAIAEDRRSGSFTWSTFMSYFRAGGPLFLPLLILLLSILIINNSFTKIFLALWTRDALHLAPGDYTKIYLGLGTFNTVLIFALIVFTVYSGIKATISIHNGALIGLLRAPMNFFDDQPVGRILNRMTIDVRELDGNLPLNVFITSRELSYFMSAVVVIAYSAPQILILFAVLVAITYSFYRIFRVSYRELKRLQSTMMSPLLSHISETMNGVSSIKAYGAQKHFIDAQRQKMDRANAASLYFQAARSWLGLRLDMLTSTVVLMLVILGGSGAIDGVAVGLGLTSAISLGTWFNNFLVAFTSTEAMFNCVERLNHYMYDLPAEPDRELPGDPAPHTWPDAGKVEVNQLELRYQSRPDRAVISNLTFSIRPGEKLGIVGRTGSGKSSLASAFFRMLNISRGSINIDGRDITKVGLKTLRSNLGIIPQEPVIFNGTIRSNLDIRSEHTDDELWNVLELVGLKTYISSRADKLEHAVVETGSNLSAGQRQLLCVARALLGKPKILIMDEATAALDAEGVDRVSDLMKTVLAKTTVISVAHNLKSIADFNRVLVVEDSKMKEIGRPIDLLNMEGSTFRSLVEATGTANADAIRQLAEQF